MKIILILTLLCFGTIQGKSFSYKQIHTMPKSIEKDYYIWRLLKQKSTSKEDARKIIKEAKRVSPKLKKAYLKKVGKAISIKPKPRKKPSKKAIKILKARQANAKKVIKSKNPFDSWLRQSDKEKIFIFNNVGKSGRKLLNHTIPSSVWDRLVQRAAFNSSLAKMDRERLNNLLSSALHDPIHKSKLKYSTLSMLGFYCISQKKPKLASRYFLESSSKSTNREEMDRALFWTYLTSKNKKYLKELNKSYDINIYTLLAKDFLHLKYPKYPLPGLYNGKKSTSFDISNPISWVKLKKRIYAKGVDLGSLAKKYNSPKTIGIYTLIKSKQSRYKQHYFPMPYRKILKKLPKSRQAILYAIARQESKFIPSSISSSYALGMMQIMPFLVDHLAKKRKEQIDYDDMFDPTISLAYANEHMNYLTKWIQHPLFVAYAYNAGIGFTRKVLRKGSLFANKMNFDPYLSIEMMPNAQANKYGKHVLANYVIYMNKLGVRLRMKDMLSTLHIPKKTDKFRK